MPKSDARARFSLGSPRIMALEAFAQSGEVERHLSWFVSYAEEVDEEDGSRIVVGTLHAAENGGSVTITVAGSFYWGSTAAEPKTRKKLSEAIGMSYALETMYDIARTQAQSLLAIAMLTVDLPLAAPEPEIREFSEGSEQEPPEVSGESHSA